MQFKKALTLLALALLIGVLIFILRDTSKFSSLHTDFGIKIPQQYPILGIDISHHQGNIDFEATANMVNNKDSVGFVYIKATEATDFKDHKLDDNANGFAKHAINYGFYHFFRPQFSALKQAHFYCTTIAPYAFKLIPVLDVEHKADCNKKQLLDSVDVFLDEVEKQLGKRPMIYTYWSFYQDNFENTRIDQELFWMAAYSQNGHFMEKEQVIIWQFTELGTVSGISNYVDLNVAKQRFNELIVLK